jgi:diguanylate cyclase (GGDEF)-like protein/PAS domain S-box-containing protein
MTNHASDKTTDAPTPNRRKRGPRFDIENLINILEMTSDIICVCLDGVITNINSVAGELLAGGNKELLIGRPFTDFVVTEYSTAIDDFVNVLADETDPFPAKMITSNGSEIGVNINIFKARELGGNYAIVLARDVTNQVRISEAIRTSEARYHKLVNNALDLICTCENGKIDFINQAGITMLGIEDAEKLIGEDISVIFHHDYREIFTENLDGLLAEDMMFPARLVRDDLSHIDVEVGLTHFDGAETSLMLEARDITAHNKAVEALFQVNKNLEQRVKERTRELTEEIELRQEVEEKLRHSASHDGLTGLPNRGLLIDRINVALASGHREKRKFALLFIDLDGFKAVNDSLGHEAGDQLLKEAANRISNHLRETDTVARIGGDEFVILLSEITDKVSVGLLAEKMRKIISAPYPVGTARGEISASIGISMYPVDGEECSALLKKADEAMYNVKKGGRNGFRFASD